MQSFTLHPRYALSFERSTWDIRQGRWIKTKLKNPHLVQTGHEPTEVESRHLKDLLSLLSDRLRTLRSLSQGLKEEETMGPEAFLRLHYRLLFQQGYGSIRNRPNAEKLESYMDQIVERYKSKKMTWEEFKSEVEDWYLLCSDAIPRDFLKLSTVSTGL